MFKGSLVLSKVLGPLLTHPKVLHVAILMGLVESSRTVRNHIFTRPVPYLPAPLYTRMKIESTSPGN